MVIIRRPLPYEHGQLPFVHERPCEPPCRQPPPQGPGSRIGKGAPGVVSVVWLSGYVPGGSELLAKAGYLIGPVLLSGYEASLLTGRGAQGNAAKASLATHLVAASCACRCWCRWCCPARARCTNDSQNGSRVHNRSERQQGSSWLSGMSASCGAGQGPVLTAVYES